MESSLAIALEDDDVQHEFLLTLAAESGEGNVGNLVAVSNLHGCPSTL